MTSPLTTPPKHGHKSLLYSEVIDDINTLDQADIAVLGIPYGSAYTQAEVSNDQSNAPTAVRQATDRAVRSPERYDFDIGGPLLMNSDVRMVDCGDVVGDARDLGLSYRNAEAAVRKILAAGALPLIIGGDHGVPIPVVRAMDSLDKPITIVHIDAHLDWRDDVNGVPDGYSSPIRRFSEMDHVGEIHQLAIRAQGSARQEEVDIAEAYGAHIHTAYEIHDRGIEAIIDEIPDGGNYYLTIDADGMDPSVMPAVNGPALGGMTYHQARKLIHALANKGRVVGMDIVEITPAKDVNRISAIAACRLFVNMIGATIKAGYYNKG